MWREGHVLVEMEADCPSPGCAAIAGSPAAWPPTAAMPHAHPAARRRHHRRCCPLNRETRSHAPSWRQPPLRRPLLLLRRPPAGRIRSGGRARRRRPPHASTGPGSCARPRPVSHNPTEPAIDLLCHSVTASNRTRPLFLRILPRLWLVPNTTSPYGSLCSPSSDRRRPTLFSMQTAHL
jgi:hypothetical protein